MAISVSSMSDEPHSSYSGTARGGHHDRVKQQQTSKKSNGPPPPPPPKKRGWARFKSRLFGGRKNNNRRGNKGTTADRAEPQSAFTHQGPGQYPIGMSTDERQTSASAFTQGSPPLYPPQQLLPAAASRRQVGLDRSSEPQSYAGTTSHFQKPKPRAYHASYFNSEPATAASAPSQSSVSARDFRQSQNAYAYNQEDESYANVANQDIDEDLEVSYFNP